VAAARNTPVGREDEFAALRAFLETPLPAALVLEGEAGIGKTTLVDAGMAAAADRGFAVLVSRPAESEVQLSFAGLADLLRGVLDEILPALPRPQRRALRVALLLAESRGPPPERHAVAASTLGALRELGRRRPVLVAVDDVQWLDAESAAALAFAVRRLDQTQVALLLALRASGDVPLPLGLDRGLAESAITHVGLAPLSREGLQELLVTRLDAAPPRPLLRRIHEASGGNPFYALEIARYLAGQEIRHVDVEGLPIPRALHELVRDRLAGLAPSTRAVLPAVAALAAPTVSLLERALGSDGHGAVADAVEAGVLQRDDERVRFAHPLIAAGVQAALTIDERRTLHARLAQVALDPEERVRHLALSAAEPDREIAAVLERAASAAARRGAFAAAAELAEHSLRLTPSEDAEQELTRRVRASRLHFETGDPARAAELLADALASAASNRGRARLLFELGRVRGQTESVELGVELAEAALRESGGDHVLGAEIEVFLAEFLRMARDGDSALPHARAAVRFAEQVGDSRPLAEALAVLGLLEFNAGAGITTGVMERALSLEESPFGAAHIVSAHQLFWSGRLQEARVSLESMIDECRSRDLPAHELLWYLAQVEFRAGDWARAFTLADDCYRLHEQLGLEGMEPLALVPLATIAAHRGDAGSARAYAERGVALAERSGHRPPLALHRSVLGFLALSLGDPVSAETELAAANEILDALAIREPGMFTTVPDRCEALAALGEHDRAAFLLEPWQERARTLDRPWAMAIAGRCRALVCAARGDVPGALAAFDDSLREHDRAGDPFQRARTLVALGVTQRRARRRRAARETLEEAVEILERLGAELWANRARDEVARISGRKPGPLGLTASEQRIAALVAQGRTNSEVAAALFLSVKTVESTLRSIYRKLDVRSRTELAGVLAKDP
jgi:DNA-binding CsgD family transcriptional regulator